MIVVMYEDAPATTILVSKEELESYWKSWLGRYTDFQHLLEHGALPDVPAH